MSNWYLPEDEHPYVDDRGCQWSSYQASVLVGLLDLCGCSDESLEEDILTTLTRYYEFEQRGDSLFYTDLLHDQPRVYVELILHLLNHAELLEHGSSVRGSWLTPKGAEVARRLIAEWEAAT